MATCQSIYSWLLLQQSNVKYMHSTTGNVPKVIENDKWWKNSNNQTKKGHCAPQKTAISYNWVGSPRDWMINALTIEQKGTQQSLSNPLLQQQSTTSKQSTNMLIVTPDKWTLSFNLVLCYASANNSTINKCINCPCFSKFSSLDNQQMHQSSCLQWFLSLNNQQMHWLTCSQQNYSLDNQLMHWLTATQQSSSIDNQLMCWSTSTRWCSSLHKQPLQWSACYQWCY